MVFRLFAGVGEEKMAMQGEMEPKKRLGASPEQASRLVADPMEPLRLKQFIHSRSANHIAHNTAVTVKLSGGATRIPS